MQDWGYHLGTDPVPDCWRALRTKTGHPHMWKSSGVIGKGVQANFSVGVQPILSMEPIVLIGCIFEGKWPKRKRNGLWPHFHLVEKNLLRNISERSNMALSNTILVVSANATKRKVLLTGFAVISERGISKTPVISAIRSNFHAMS